MTTRKHFRLMAETISKIKDKGARLLAAQAAIKVFSAENPRFNKNRFLEACGL